MRINHEDLEAMAAEMGETNVTKIMVVEQLMLKINSYRKAVDGARNFAGSVDDPEVYEGLFRAGCAIAGLVLIPYDSMTHAPTWFLTHLDCSVEPQERYWIAPHNDYMKYL